MCQVLPGRKGKQCRERWHNHLNPDIIKVCSLLPRAIPNSFCSRCSVASFMMENFSSQVPLWCASLQYSGLSWLRMKESDACAPPCPCPRHREKRLPYACVSAAPMCLYAPMSTSNESYSLEGIYF